ncbi:MAG: hypothetical protein HOI49_08485 [Bacteroidetes bacterium]|jgi:hypothetical protein|nr:hypothetical protein [Bacteroidota bacterium]
MRGIIYLFIGVFCLAACMPSDSVKTWVYIELAIDNKKVTDEFVYGQIDSKTVEAFKNKRATNRLFTVENIRYISLQDSLEVEEDEDNFGNATYNILDVRQVEYLKKDPLFIESEVPLSARSLRIKNSLLRNSK